MPGQTSQGSRGIQPPYLSMMSSFIMDVYSCMKQDRMIEALNILRFADALAFPGDKDQLIAQFDSRTLPGIMSIERTALQGDGYPEDLKAEAIRKEKALILEHMELLMGKLHARDAWIHEQFFIEGGQPIG